jgi:ribose/xylose/arabinose/galactoside ABC-type transport system permease subunit
LNNRGRILKDARQRSGVIREFAMLIILLVIVGVLSILSPKFAQFDNFINIFKQTAINGILATGMAMVILTGGFDLSVGSIVGLSGVVAALLAQGNYPIYVPVLAAILIGTIAGLFNGTLVSYFGIPAFVVTLGSQSIIRGLAYVVSGGRPVFGVCKAYENIAGGKLFGVIPYLVIYLFIIVLVVGFVLTKTIYGRRLYAVGGNEEAAKVSGINVKAMKMSAFMIAGLLSGVAGMLLTSRAISGSPQTGEGYELDAIAAVVIGGFSLSGGSGKWYGIIIGALILSVLGNGLDILGIKSFYQLILKGTIVILAVYLDVRSRRKISA